MAVDLSRGLDLSDFGADDPDEMYLDPPSPDFLIEKSQNDIGNY